jgi:hypothetical protein
VADEQQKNMTDECFTVLQDVTRKVEKRSEAYGWGFMRSWG